MQVADELVTEISQEPGGYEQKNIRRRVYDALNVLMAIDVIRKDKKEIKWVGFPDDMTQCSRRLQSEHVALRRRVEEKKKAMMDLLRRFVCLKSLVTRNARLEAGRADLVNGVTSLMTPGPTDRLLLPFVLINASRDCRVHCEMLEDRYYTLLTCADHSISSNSTRHLSLRMTLKCFG